MMRERDDCGGPRESTGDEPLRFLAERVDYERARSMPNSEEAFKLDRMRDLLRQLGNPQQGLRIVHVAGTKGKGSTAAMIAAMLSAAGLRTGLFTSPHITSVEERVAIDGRPCSTEELAEAIAWTRPAVESLDHAASKVYPPELGPTYFEILTAAALGHFAKKRVDAAVLEVGLGGRLDSTNVCTPAVSIITSISYDHVAQLGPTLADIAREKAGIIKPGVPVVSGVVDDEPREVIRAIARENRCRLVELGVDFDFDYAAPRHLERAAAPARLRFLDRTGGHPPDAPRAEFLLGLAGRHQAANAAIALAAVGELQRAGWTISESAVHEGLAGLVWPGRVEVVSRRPTVVLDAAHNRASVEALAETLDESFSARRRYLVFAASREKDVDGMLEVLLPRFDRVVFTQYYENPRAVPPEELLAAAGKRDGMEIARRPAEAWAAVRRMASADDLICVTGSFFIAAEMRRAMAAHSLLA